MSNLVLIAAPEMEALGVSEVKAHSRLDLLGGEEDALIEQLITAARIQVETVECAIQLVAAEYELQLDGFPACRRIVLPKPPLLSVESVKYIDSSGALQTLSSALYTVNTKWTAGQMPSGIPGDPEIILNYGESWPTTRCEPGAVRIRFRCGFGEVAGSPPAPPEIPAGIKQWIVVATATMFEHREAEVIGGGALQSLRYVGGLLDPWRANKWVA